MTLPAARRATRESGPSTSATDGDDGDELLVIASASGQPFALLAVDVAEVQRMVWVSPLPDAPPGVEGIIDVRGDVIPVLDLRPRFGLSSEPVTITDRLVLVRTAARRLALRVDSTIALRTVPTSDIWREGLDDAPYAAGVVRLPDGLVVLHDIDAFLSHDEAVVLDEALARRTEQGS